MTAFTGTGRLVRLALRRDRLALPIWILAIVGVIGLDLVAVIDLYAGTPEDRATYAATQAPSIVGRVTGGPLDGASTGAIVMNEVFLFFAVEVAFMNVLTVVRHTRQNEETGRAELLGAAIVGRYASLTAVLLVATLANAVVGALVVLALLATGLPGTGSVAAGVAVGAVGLVFAAVAAVTAQVAESARGANSLAVAAIGVAFLLRAVGDGLGDLTQNGRAVVSAWPSWGSPIGWGQQIHPFTQGNWWVFGLLAALLVALVGVSFALTSRRDVGLGLLPVRRGPAAAAPGLLSPFGLAWRLQRGLLRGWAIAIAVLGTTVGIMAKEFDQLLTDNEQLADILAQLGGRGSVTDVFFGAMLSLAGLVIAGYALQALLRLHAEEAGGRLEPVLATSVSRPGWMLSHLGCVLIGVVTLIVVLGASTGIAFVIAAGQSWREVAELIGAAVAQVPAVLALAGGVVAVFGLLPRWALALSWGGLAAAFVIGQLGPLLDLPQWVMNLSPFTHAPAAPAEAVTVVPIVTLLAIAITASTAGVLFFRRRNYAF